MSEKPAFQVSPLKDLKPFQDSLIDWFRSVGEPHPWRQTQEPYEILVSEVMLQQTTIQAVLENKRFEKFLHTFPTITELAQASEQEILRAWEGLGYYNRVRNLQKTAQAVLTHHDGEFPRSQEALLALPGIGRYTAAAVASFAFDQSVALVDANVSRIFSRLFDDHTAINSPAGQKTTWLRAEKLIPPSHAKFYNSALMELGQKVCRAKEVQCHTCPIATYCQTSIPLELPKKAPKQKTVEITEYAVWAQQKDGSLLLEKGTGSRRNGMWTLPLLSAEETTPRPLLHQSQYSITNHKVTLKVYELEDASLVKTAEWVTLSALETLPIPSPFRKVINTLLHSLL